MSLDADGVATLALPRRGVDETVRLYPPAYLTSRAPLHETQVAGCPVTRTGVVATCVYALHRNGITLRPDGPMWARPVAG